MEEGCDANMARKQATFFKRTIIMVTSEKNHVLHVASGVCVIKICIIIAYVKGISIFIKLASDAMTSEVDEWWGRGSDVWLV